MLIGSWFYNAELNTGPLLQGMHHHSLMFLSIVIAIAASWLALQVAGLARVAVNESARKGAIVSGAAALAGGIWAMHFIGMLAYDIGMPVRFDPAITLLSFLPALAASLIALPLLSRRELGWSELARGGILIGLGIGCMHYTGMLAMRADAQLLFDPAWFVASILVATGLSTLALRIRFGLSQKSPRALFIAALIMGLAIASMHYAGMAAARFIGIAPANYSPEYSQHLTLGLIIALTTLILGGLVGVVNGIVRFSQLYRQVHDSEAQTRAVFDTAVDAIVSSDEHGTIHEMNRAAERLFGWSMAELVGQNMRLLLTDQSYQGHLAFLREFNAGLRPRLLGKSLDSTCRRRDGSEFPVRVAIGQTGTGDVVRFVGFISDTSEQRRLEQSLQQREEQYRTLIANIPGTSFRCLPRNDWPMLFISEAAEQLTGWPADDFLAGGKSFAALIHPNDEQRCYDRVMHAISKREKYNIEYRIIHRDGSERWVSESASAIFDEQGTAQWIDGVMIDITHSKQRNAEFEGIVYAISQAQGMLELGMDATILSVNERFLALSGYARSSLLGAPHALVFEPCDESNQLWPRLSKGDYVAGEFSLRHIDGHVVYVQAYYNPILDTDGKPRKVIMLATDLSERHRMEVDLVEAKERAELAAESKGAFLANMSHEIRTPMNAIIGFSDVLLSDNQLPAAQQQHVKTVHNAARSLLGLLNDILDTAKLEKGAVQLEYQSFSLFELCQQLLAVFRLEATQKGLQLTFDYQLDQHYFYGDAMRLRQVLTNLLGNAIKFTLDGQVELQVSSAQDGICIRLRDTGIGIDPQRIKLIFEPFAQADASMSRRFGGTGLGTTISRQLVELMGGSIKVESEEGVGSCFIIQLPLIEAQSLQPSSSSKRITLPPLKILVADDVADNLRLMEVILSADGHSVTCVTNGLAAFERMTEQHFDLILMDMQMPEVSGLEATRIIRRYETNLGRPPTPIIALTASVLDKDREAAKAAGMDGFASKPVDRLALQREMCRALQLTEQLTDEPAMAAPAPAEGSINWSEGAQRWGSSYALEQALRLFLQSNQDTPGQLAQLLETGQSEGAAALLHRLRGSAANLGLQQVQLLATAMESRITEENLGDLTDAVHELHEALQAAEAAIPAPTEDQQTVAKLPITQQQQQQRHKLLSNLIASLKRGEMLESRLSKLVGLVSEPRLTLIQQALDDFDFHLAVQQLELELAAPVIED